MPVDSSGKQLGFDIIAVRMLEKLETMVSWDRSQAERARRQKRTHILRNGGAILV